MSDPGGEKKCLACGRSDDQIPLIPLEYRGRRLWICPRHMPQLIHQPEELADRLPGVEEPAAD